uniref:Uncharacterized protein n=1 Tax=Oltmannsiellopsis viridis TaxID=51324 RepID=Q0QIQ7_OLTVI|nr:hypothetical protein OlviMp14 [Oltmannsiellopsis viridis]ABC96346.1 hypothetical protein [Oltmannsiellopsis viridis]
MVLYNKRFKVGATTNKQFEIYNMEKSHRCFMQSNYFAVGENSNCFEDFEVRVIHNKTFRQIMAGEVAIFGDSCKKGDTRYSVSSMLDNPKVQVVKQEKVLYVGQLNQFSAEQPAMYLLLVFWNSSNDDVSFINSQGDGLQIPSKQLYMVFTGLYKLLQKLRNPSKGRVKTIDNPNLYMIGGYRPMAASNIKLGVYSANRTIYRKLSGTQLKDAYSLLGLFERYIRALAVTVCARVVPGLLSLHLNNSSYIAAQVSDDKDVIDASPASKTLSMKECSKVLETLDLAGSEDVKASVREVQKQNTINPLNSLWVALSILGMGTSLSRGYYSALHTDNASPSRLELIIFSSAKNCPYANGFFVDGINALFYCPPSSTSVIGVAAFLPHSTTAPSFYDEHKNNAESNKTLCELSANGKLVDNEFYGLGVFMMPVLKLDPHTRALEYAAYCYAVKEGLLSRIDAMGVNTYNKVVGGLLKTIPYFRDHSLANFKNPLACLKESLEDLSVNGKPVDELEKGFRESVNTLDDPTAYLHLAVGLTPRNRWLSESKLFDKSQESLVEFHLSRNTQTANLTKGEWLRHLEARKITSGGKVSKPTNWKERDLQILAAQNTSALFSRVGVPVTCSLVVSKVKGIFILSIPLPKNRRAACFHQLFSLREAVRFLLAECNLLDRWSIHSLPMEEYEDLSILLSDAKKVLKTRLKTRFNLQKTEKTPGILCMEKVLGDHFQDLGISTKVSPETYGKDLTFGSLSPQPLVVAAWRKKPVTRVVKTYGHRNHQWKDAKEHIAESKMFLPKPKTSAN